jgi:hypothetical protein
MASSTTPFFALLLRFYVTILITCLLTSTPFIALLLRFYVTILITTFTHFFEFNVRVRVNLVYLFTSSLIFTGLLPCGLIRLLPRPCWSRDSPCDLIAHLVT